MEWNHFTSSPLGLILDVKEVGGFRSDLPGYFCVCLERAAISSSMGWDVVASAVSLSLGTGPEEASFSAIVQYLDCSIQGKTKPR